MGKPRNRQHHGLLAERLRELRGLRNLSQSGLAAASGVRLSQLRNYEQGKSFPDLADAAALAAALQVRPESLRPVDVGYGNPNLTARALWQLGDVYGLSPGGNERFAYLAPTTSFMTEALRGWASAFEASAARGTEGARRSYFLWMRSFSLEFDATEFPLRYPAFDPESDPDGREWERHVTAELIRGARERRGLSQPALAELSGAKVYTLRSYEQCRRIPRDEQIEGLARAMDMRWESLVAYDFGSPVLAVHTLFDLSGAYGLRPDLVDGLPVLRTVAPGLERVLDNWAAAEERLRSDGDDMAYALWRDTFDEGSAGASELWRNRY